MEEYDLGNVCSIHRVDEVPTKDFNLETFIGTGYRPNSKWEHYIRRDLKGEVRSCGLDSSL
jgi:hypothetical protein